jgi:hypothetical protein
MTDYENKVGGAGDHEEKDLPVKDLEVSELEEGDLDDVSGGNNSRCPIEINAGC